MASCSNNLSELFQVLNVGPIIRVSINQLKESSGFCGNFHEREQAQFFIMSNKQCWLEPWPSRTRQTFLVPPPAPVNHLHTGWFWCYLAECCQHVKLNFKALADTALQCAVHQCSALGPILFTSNISQLGQTTDRYQIARQLFTDDTQDLHMTWIEIQSGPH